LEENAGRAAPARGGIVGKDRKIEEKAIEQD
jgi:hypothetical protein